MPTGGSAPGTRQRASGWAPAGALQGLWGGGCCACWAAQRQASGAVHRALQEVALHHTGTRQIPGWAHLKPTSTACRRRMYQDGAKQGMRKRPRQTMMDRTRWKRSLPGRLLQARRDASWVTPCSSRHALRRGRQAGTQQGVARGCAAGGVEPGVAWQAARHRAGERQRHERTQISRGRGRRTGGTWGALPSYPLSMRS